MKLYLTSFLIFISSSGFSQVTGVLLDMDLDGEVNIGNVGNVDLTSRKTVGTPFLSEDWLKGKVYTRKGSIIDDVTLNINIYEGTILIKRNNGIIQSLYQERLEALEMEDNRSNKYYFRNISGDSVDGEFMERFYEVLFRKDNLLVKLREKNLKKADYQRAYASGNTQDEYKDKTRYYMKGDDGFYNQIRLSRKSVIKNMKSEYREQVSEYIKINRHIITDEKSLIDLLNKSIN